MYDKSDRTFTFWRKTKSYIKCKVVLIKHQRSLVLLALLGLLVLLSKSTTEGLVAVLLGLTLGTSGSGGSSGVTMLKKMKESPGKGIHLNLKTSKLWNKNSNNPAYTDKEMLGGVLVLSLNIVVDKAESGSLSTTELVTEAEENNTGLILNLVEVSDLLTKVSLGDTSHSRVDNVKDLET